MEYLYHTPPTKAQGLSLIRGWKTLRARGQKDGSEAVHVLGTWQNCCTHQLTAAAAACTRPAPDQATQGPAWRMKVLMKPHFRLRSCWQLTAAGGRRVRFLFDSVDLGRSTMLQLMASYSGLCKQHKLEPAGYWGGTWSWEGVVIGGSPGRSESWREGSI